MTKLILTHNWSVEYDGKSILELMAAKSKMTYAEIENVIVNEGGYIKDGTIHAGSAKDKLVEID